MLVETVNLLNLYMFAKTVIIIPSSMKSCAKELVKKPYLSKNANIRVGILNSSIAINEQLSVARI